MPMISSVKMCFATISLIAAGMTAPVWAQDAAKDMTAETVVATVNGTDITLGHMIALRDSLPEQYLSLDDKVLFDGVLEQLIQQTALAEEREEALTARDKLMIEVDRRAYLSGAVLNQIAQSAISEDAVKEAYDAKYASVEPSREYHAAHILVKTEDEAKAIHEAIVGGADFAEQAKEHSLDGSSASGGDLGWFPLGAMVEPFANAVAALKADEVSAPVETQFGWHIVKLFEDRLAEAPKIEDVREEIEGEVRAAAVEGHVAALMEDIKVERLVDGVDPAILRSNEILED
jgi:peptidyl-prolyl cis-trans isomerase C